MLKHSLISLALFVAVAAQAQNTLPPAPSTNTAGNKKELVARIIRAQQTAIEGLARQITERPAVEMLAGAMQVVAARVPREKQEAVAKDIQSDAQRYADSAVPIVTRRAIEIAPSTMGAVLEEQFSEDELKQIATLLENPTVLKFQRLLPDMQKSLGERLVADTRPQIEPKVAAMEDAVNRKLTAIAGPPGQAQQGGGKAPAKKQ